MLQSRPAHLHTTSYASVIVITIVIPIIQIIVVIIVIVILVIIVIAMVLQEETKAMLCKSSQTWLLDDKYPELFRLLTRPLLLGATKIPGAHQAAEPAELRTSNQIVHSVRKNKVLIFLGGTYSPP